MKSAVKRLCSGRVLADQVPRRLRRRQFAEGGSIGPADETITRSSRKAVILGPSGPSTEAVPGFGDTV